MQVPNISINYTGQSSDVKHNPSKNCGWINGHYYELYSEFVRRFNAKGPLEAFVKPDDTTYVAHGPSGVCRLVDNFESLEKDLCVEPNPIVWKVLETTPASFALPTVFKAQTQTVESETQAKTELSTKKRKLQVNNDKQLIKKRKIKKESHSKKMDDLKLEMEGNKFLENVSIEKKVTVPSPERVCVSSQGDLNSKSFYDELNLTCELDEFLNEL